MTVSGTARANTAQSGEAALLRTPSAQRIGYYVHHHGRGHATRAGVIGAALAAEGHQVTYLGSGPLPPGDQVVLDRDDTGDSFPDAEAGGRLHWAPLGGGYARRAQHIAAWIADARPDVVVVDVSVEVAALARLSGVPVVLIAQPGNRTDVAHSMAFDLATAIVAPWPAGLSLAPHLTTWEAKTTAVGGVSRFAAAPARSALADPVHRADAAHPADAARPRGVFLVGGEGWDDPGLPDAVRARVPEVDWRTPSTTTPLETLLAEADVVLSHAGQNAVADIAAFGVPAVVVAQERPFAEQADMARALDQTGLARGFPPGADAPLIAQAVREVLAQPDARRAAAESWQRWNIEGAASRAAHVVANAAQVPR